MFTEWKGLQAKHLVVGDKFVLVSDLEYLVLGGGRRSGNIPASLSEYTRIEGSRNIPSLEFHGPAGHENETLMPLEWLKPGVPGLELLVDHKGEQKFISDGTPVVKIC